MLYAREARSSLLFLWTALLPLPVEAEPRPESTRRVTGRPRIIATTDGEIDDRCSMVRFLLYANEWEIEGIVYSSSKFHWKGHHWAGETWIHEDIDRYGTMYDNLMQHAPGFPTPRELREVTFVGNIDGVGEMSSDTPGSDRIVDVLLDPDPGPVYLQAWGGTNTIARALWRIQHEHPEQMAKVSEKAVIYVILDQDKTLREYIVPNWPDIEVLGSFRQFACIAYGWNRHIPSEFHRFYRGPWMKEHILEGHGPLCARYEAHRKGGAWGDGDFRSEGDSPALMHQIRNGLGGLEHPSYGGWGGRFVREKGTRNVWRGAEDDGDRNKPIWRWSEHFQNDWAARADWCVRSFEEANHNPVVAVNGVRGKDVVRLKAHPGSTVVLSADGTTDPDGDALSYEWWYYKAPSTYPDDVSIESRTSPQARFAVPFDCEENEYHVILTVRDDGSPNLFAYRRVIVQAAAGEDPTAPGVPPKLRGKPRNETSADLRWESASDPESGVRRYLIYRDGARIAESRTTAFSDTALREATEYAYQVSAVNGCSMEGARSEIVRVVTPPDRIPPRVARVRAAGKTVAVLFTEPVERASAENPGHYAIDGGVSVGAARLSSDQRTVLLKPSRLRDGETYTITVRDVRDRAKAPNRLASATKARFMYRERAPLVRVGVPDGDSPVTLHGAVRREEDGSLFLEEGPPWRWIAVGVDGEPMPILEGLRSFTILGWAKATSLSTGSGGNRLAFNLNYNRSGFDLVHHRDGRLRLAVNEWPDRARNDSSPGKIRVGRWVFFAVTYDGTKSRNNVRWYFGEEENPAELDRVTTYSRGSTKPGSGPLTIGNYNTTIHRHGVDRQFRGWLRGIAIFGSQTGDDGALDLESIREYQ